MAMIGRAIPIKNYLRDHTKSEFWVTTTLMSRCFGFSFIKELLNYAEEARIQSLSITRQ